MRQGQRWQRPRGRLHRRRSARSATRSTKILTAGEGGTLLTNDEALARRAHSIIDCGRPKDAAEPEYTFGANYRLGELHAALLVSQFERFPAQRAERARERRATSRS